MHRLYLHIVLAAWDLAGRRPRGADDATISGRWCELVDAVAFQEGQDVLLSDEYLATRTRRQARRAINDLSAPHEVHVVVTVRDLGRVLTSSWPEDVKSGSTVTWPEYVAAVRDPEQITRNPARGFWLRQDLAHVLAVWSVAAGADRIHVVTVPPPGARPLVLLERGGQVVGYDAATLTTPPRRANESLGAPGAEVVRRLNELLGGRLNQRQYDWVVKYALDLHMRPTGTARTALPDEHLPWARGQAARLVARSATAGTAWWATSTTSPHERPRDARRTRRPRASCSRRRWRRCGPSPSRTPGPGGCAAPARRCGGGAGDPCDQRAPVRGGPHAPQGGRARRPQRGRVGGDGGLPHGAAATVRATTATVKVASTTAPSTSPVTPPNRRTA